MQTNTNQAKLAHSIKSAAAALDCSVIFIRRAIKSGELPAKKFTRKVVIRDEDLQSFLNSQADYKQ